MLEEAIVIGPRVYNMKGIVIATTCYVLFERDDGNDQWNLDPHFHVCNFHYHGLCKIFIINYPCNPYVLC